MKLEIINVTKKYADKKAVDNLNLTLTNGVYALLGANGSGKTTLMRMIADVLKPTQGEIHLDGESIKKLDAEYRNLIGYLPQNFGYYKDFTAEDFLYYFCALKGINGSFRKSRTEELLKYVDLYSERKKKIKTFSGGMRQRLGIAQALLNNPAILILDEPTAGLDPKERIRFRNLMTEMSKDRIVIYATHIVSDISFIADRVLIMKEGRIVADGTVQSLTESVKGKVWRIKAKREALTVIQKHFNIGEVFSESDGFVALKLLCDEKPCENAEPCEPDLSDVYLNFFGEVSINENHYTV